MSSFKGLYTFPSLDFVPTSRNGLWPPSWGEGNGLLSAARTPSPSPSPLLTSTPLSDAPRRHPHENKSVATDIPSPISGGDPHVPSTPTRTSVTLSILSNFVCDTSYFLRQVLLDLLKSRILLQRKEVYVLPFSFKLRKSKTLQSVTSIEGSERRRNMLNKVESQDKEKMRNYFSFFLDM